jgi:general secretion pathway protein A
VYLESFGLKKDPFALVSDADGIYYSESHCEAIAHLLYAMRERKGISLLLGEAGTGKTTLVRLTVRLLQNTKVTSCCILNPMLESTRDLLECVLSGFGLEYSQCSLMEMTDTLWRYLVQQCEDGAIPVLFVDEAQQLSRQTLEQIRLLSNLESRGQKLLQIVLAAQPEMTQLLAEPAFAALRQRIAVRTRLRPLTAQEVWEYLATRIKYADGDGRLIFSPDACARLAAFSNGVPRVINVIADNCLLAAYAQGVDQVTKSFVEQVAEHLELTVDATVLQRQSTLGDDILRASNMWGEIVCTARTREAPEALLCYIEGLRRPHSNSNRPDSSSSLRERQDPAHSSALDTSQRLPV